jgi:hypothetical protein
MSASQTFRDHGNSQDVATKLSECSINGFCTSTSTEYFLFQAGFAHLTAATALGQAIEVGYRTDKFNSIMGAEPINIVPAPEVRAAKRVKVTAEKDSWLSVFGKNATHVTEVGDSEDEMDE